ncbi:hypothetical protein EON67_02615 [archaeon]|nr:MAG: hypothetical protein EON67_02615 [archaeon]
MLRPWQRPSLCARSALFVPPHGHCVPPRPSRHILQIVRAASAVRVAGDTSVHQHPASADIHPTAWLWPA